MAGDLSHGQTSTRSSKRSKRPSERLGSSREKIDAANTTINTKRKSSHSIDGTSQNKKQLKNVLGKNDGIEANTHSVGSDRTLFRTREEEDTLPDGSRMSEAVSEGWTEGGDSNPESVKGMPHASLAVSGRHVGGGKGGAARDNNAILSNEGEDGTTPPTQYPTPSLLKPSAAGDEIIAQVVPKETIDTSNDSSNNDISNVKDNSIRYVWHKLFSSL